jgi:hypothetical protein
VLLLLVRRLGRCGGRGLGGLRLWLLDGGLGGLVGLGLFCLRGSLVCHGFTLL